jgi:hypothetical protein
MPADALRRFTPTPFKATFALEGVSVVVSTNLQCLADRLQDALGCHPPRNCPAFHWRVVVESNGSIQPESMSNRRLSYDGLGLITIGQNCFLACDLETQEGIGFIPQCLVDNDDLFHKNLLPALIALMEKPADKPLDSGC